MSHHQKSHNLRAIIPNQNTDSLEEHQFNIGELLGVSNDLHNGYLMGDLIQSNGTKIKNLLRYPKFKVVESVQSTSFKVFEKAH